MSRRAPTTRTAATASRLHTTQVKAVELSQNLLQETQPTHGPQAVEQSSAGRNEQKDARSQIGDALLSISAPERILVRHEEMRSYRFQQDLVDMGLMAASELAKYNGDVPEATDRILEDKPPDPRHVSRMRQLEDGIDLSAGVDAEKFVEDHMPELDYTEPPAAREHKTYLTAGDFHTMQDIALGLQRQRRLTCWSPPAHKT